MRAELQDNKIKLSFDYNRATIAKVKTLNGRTYKPSEKAWFVPTSTCDVNLLIKWGFYVTNEVIDATKEQVDRARALDTLANKDDEKFETSLPLYPFQRVVGAFMIKAGSCLNACDVGTGKTITSLSAIEVLKSMKNLVIAPKSVLRQWEKEVNTFLPIAKVFVVEGDKEERQRIYNEVKTYDKQFILITSYDLMRIDIEFICSMSFQTTICDEAHRIGNPFTKTRKALKKIDCNYRFALTATPLRSSLSNYYGIIDWISPGYLGSYFSFLNCFALKNQFGAIIQYIHVEEFKNRIKRFMIRRTLDEVGYQLPALIEEDIIFDMSDKELTLMKKMKQEVLFEISKIDINKLKNPTSLAYTIVKLGKLRELCDSMELLGQNNTSSKLDTLKDHLKDTLIGDKKAVIFSCFERMIGILARELFEYNPAIITGKIKDRQAEIDKFNKDDSCRTMLITSAGGEGLNLERANIMYFYDVPLGSYGALVQTIGRIKRIGQTREMLIYYLLARKTIETGLKKKLMTKKELSDRIFSSVTEIKELLDDTNDL